MRTNSAPIRGSFFTNTKTYEDSPSFDEQIPNVRFSPAIGSFDIKPLSFIRPYAYSDPVLIRYRAVNTLAAMTLPVYDGGICNDKDRLST
jgi:hypothetical protein